MLVGMLRDVTDDVFEIPERLEVVEQGTEGAEIENREALPVLAQHPREQRQGCGLGLSGRGRRQQQGMSSIEQGSDGSVLQRPEIRPAEGVDDVVLNRGVEAIAAIRMYGTHDGSLMSSTDSAPRSIAVSSRLSTVS